MFTRTVLKPKHLIALIVILAGLGAASINSVPNWNALNHSSLARFFHYFGLALMIAAACLVPVLVTRLVFTSSPTTVSKTIQRKYAKDVINGIIWNWTWSKREKDRQPFVRTATPYCLVCNRLLEVHGPYSDLGGLAVWYECPEHPGRIIFIGTTNNAWVTVYAVIWQRVADGTWNRQRSGYRRKDKGASRTGLRHHRRRNNHRPGHP
jgi:hypothetical protein